MKITITIPQGFSNFHNVGPISFVCDPKVVDIFSTSMGTCFTLTPSQSARMTRHFCGLADCKCASGLVSNDYNGRYWVKEGALT